MDKERGRQMNCMLRKLMLKKVNEVLESRKDNIDACKKAVDVWQSRTQLVLDNVKSLRAKLDDNKLEDREIEEFVEELKKTVQSW